MPGTATVLLRTVAVLFGRGGGAWTMRIGDYLVAMSAILNFLALMAYVYQGHWRNAAYFAGACIINASLVGMR